MTPSPVIQMDDGHAHPVRNIFCIGRNYAAHVAELGNTSFGEPVVFMKPSHALLHAPGPIRLPAHSQDIHHEAELVLYIGRQPDPGHLLQSITGYGLGLDLTARDLQSHAKQHGLPWTLAKGFPGSACVSRFRPAEQIEDLSALNFTLHVNEQLRQHSDLNLMLYPLETQLRFLLERVGLDAGDLVFTGTPAGVAALQPGDQLQLAFTNGSLSARFSVEAA
ncbi:fumarylacetoacetate hydrolase family protein [Leeia aquatica]|uniref:Fumarylacetoacetate hydrolase family protein n=1 Tax=Leeia aquatica TaxID=2725557 RepID=A0A847S5Q3_9NEIS|nr:fumarylacetoacetate hydrolase family protein [Leeia aquatica]NLR74125.1 fumarylacetoacetate hydrolase family protein [Leeia aquatica]